MSLGSLQFEPWIEVVAYCLLFKLLVGSVQIKKAPSQMTIVNCTMLKALKEWWEDYGEDH